MNCPLGFNTVSRMREGQGIQPPRRQERQGGEADVTLGHDLSGPSANQGRDPDFDFDFDRNNDLADRSLLVLVLAVSSCTCTCTASLCTCTFLGRAGGRPKRYPLSHPDPESLPQRARWRFRPACRGRARFHALHPTFWGNFLVLPFQLTKAVVENGYDATAPPPPNTPQCL